MSSTLGTLSTALASPWLNIGITFAEFLLGYCRCYYLLMDVSFHVVYLTFCFRIWTDSDKYCCCNYCCLRTFDLDISLQCKESRYICFEVSTNSHNFLRIFLLSGSWLVGLFHTKVQMLTLMLRNFQRNFQQIAQRDKACVCSNNYDI